MGFSVVNHGICAACILGLGAHSCTEILFSDVSSGHERADWCCNSGRMLATWCSWIENLKYLS